MRRRQRITVESPPRPALPIQDGLGDLYGLIPLTIPSLLGWASESWLVFGMVLTSVVIFTMFSTAKGVWRFYLLARSLV